MTDGMPSLKIFGGKIVKAKRGIANDADRNSFVFFVMRLEG
jgi:hypothetical protein